MSISPEVKAALEALVAAVNKEDGTAAPAPVIPWHRQAFAGPFPSIGAEAAESELKQYASQGYRANGTRGVASQDLERFRAIADRLAAASSPQEADAILPGAGHFSPDVAIYLVMTGAVQGLGAFQTPSIFAPWGAWDSILAAAGWELGVVTPDTPGPGV